jgi:hypothetical protein
MTDQTQVTRITEHQPHWSRFILNQDLEAHGETFALFPHTSKAEGFREYPRRVFRVYSSTGTTSLSMM